MAAQRVWDEHANQLPSEKALPVLRGSFLQVAASAVSTFPFIAKLVYNQAEFNRIRRLAPLLEPYPVRYSPCIVPDAATAAGPDQETDGDFVQNWLKAARARTTGSPYVSVADFHEAYLAKTATPTQVARALLALIRPGAGKKSRHFNAFSQVESELVLAAAAASTARYEAGAPLSPLDGVPVAIKDQVYVVGYKSTFGTRLQVPKSTTNSWCVQQWLDAGAVVVGMANMHELGMDTTNNNPNFGTPLNPHNSSYYTGGSSGGSAYALAAGVVPIALGADGGGSIRLPSSLCGVYGLKTSHDRVSALPLRNPWTSTGVVGPMASSVADLHLAYRLMARPDPLDENSARFASAQAGQPEAPTKTLGVCKAWVDRADAPVKEAYYKALDYLQHTHGYTIKDITIPFLLNGQLAHALTILSEASAATLDLAELNPANKILLSIARQASGTDFVLGQKLKQLLMEHLQDLFKQDPSLIIATPTVPFAGWPIKSPADLKYGCSDSPMSLRSMEYVWLANFTGIPALSAPVGYAEPAQGEGKLPIGLMLMGCWGTDEALIRQAALLEEFLGKERRAPAGVVRVLESDSEEEVLPKASA